MHLQIPKLQSNSEQLKIYGDDVVAGILRNAMVFRFHSIYFQDSVLSKYNSHNDYFF